jgi:hypothetical protein
MIPGERPLGLSHRGTQRILNMANDYAYTYAPFIGAAASLPPSSRLPSAQFYCCLFFALLMDEADGEATTE